MRRKIQKKNNLTGTAKKLESWLVVDEKRNNQYFVCIYCLDVIPVDAITIDHRKPKALGGKNTKDNLVPCCQRCNNLKAHLSYSDFMLYIIDTLAVPSPDFSKKIPNLERRIKLLRYIIKESQKELKRVRKNNRELIHKLMLAKKALKDV